MTVGIRNRWVVWTALVCAWISSVAARSHADFEIESFTRYRLIRMDNNNNGYVDDFAIIDEPIYVENTIATEVLENKSSPPTELPEFNSSALSGSRATTTEMSRNNSGAVHVAARIPGGSGFVDYGFPNLDSYTVAVDFDDPHTFNTAFDSFIGSSYLQGRGVQLEKVIRFSPKVSEDEPNVEEPTTLLEVFYGARFYQFDDYFTFEGSGGILGRTWALTSVENQHGGLHVGIQWNLRHDGWMFAVYGLVQSGLGATDSRQAGGIGEDLNPGAINSSIFAQPHVVGYHVDDQFNTIYSEIRAQAKRELSKLVTMTIGCSSYYYSDVKYAGQSVNWFLPDLGVLTGTEDSTVTTVFASLELRH